MGCGNGMSTDFHSSSSAEPCHIFIFFEESVVILITGAAAATSRVGKENKALWALKDVQHGGGMSGLKC